MSKYLNETKMLYLIFLLEVLKYIFYFMIYLFEKICHQKRVLKGDETVPENNH